MVEVGSTIDTILYSLQKKGVTIMEDIMTNNNTLVGIGEVTSAPAPVAAKRGFNAKLATGIAAAVLAGGAGYAGYVIGTKSENKRWEAWVDEHVIFPDEDTKKQEVKKSKSKKVSKKVQKEEPVEEDDFEYYEESEDEEPTDTEAEDVEAEEEEAEPVKPAKKTAKKTSKKK